MTSRRGFWAALTIGALVACEADAPAPPRAARAPLADPLTSIAGSVAESLFGALLQATGLFEALGLGGPDQWTKDKLNEISAKIDHLDADIAALADQVAQLEKIVVTLPARQTIDEARVRFTTCYEHHLRPPTAPITDPAALEEHNRALLARAYQVVGLPPPAGLFLQDQDCAILEKLEAVQAAILPTGPGASRPLVETARLARLSGEPFDRVTAYFGWAVGVQRHGLAILAQAHHRLGKDADLADVLARARRSLRGQEIELLHAAEAYVAYQAYDGTFSGDALALADQVVARMEGTPWFVTSSALFVSPWAGVALSPPTVAQGGADPVALDDVLAADPGILPAGDDTAYSTQRPDLVHPENQPFAYVMTLAPKTGVEVGRSRNVTIARYRTTRISPAAGTVDFSPWLALPARSLPLQARNAATLELEDSARSRLLLAHSGAAGSAVSRFTLDPTPDDPRRAKLAVDEPARGLSGVPVGPVGGTAWFAALPGLADATFELVPAGPAEPDRFALRLDDGRWLGTAPSAPPSPDQPEPFAYALAVSDPFYFDVERGEDACELSYVGSDGIRRFLYVNEQIVSASEWQASAPWPSQADLAQTPEAFAEGDIRNFCPPQYGQPNNRLSLDLHGGSEGAVTCSVGVYLAPLLFPGGADPGGITCYLSNVTAGTTVTLFRCWPQTGFGGGCTIYTGTAPTLQNPYYQVAPQILPGNVHRFWCEHAWNGNCYDFVGQFGEPGLQISVQ